MRGQVRKGDKVVIQGLEKILKDKPMSLQTKTRIVNAMIFPVILYGCETWTKTREMEKQIDACGSGERCWGSLGLRREKTSRY